MGLFIANKKILIIVQASGEINFRGYWEQLMGIILPSPNLRGKMNP